MKLVSVNIEADKHLASVKEFLAREQADAICLMECAESSLAELVGVEYPFYAYTPNFIWHSQETMRLAVVAKQPVKTAGIFRADGSDEQHLPLASEFEGTHIPVVLLTEVGDGKNSLRLGAVHFTWTPHGSVTQQQAEHFEKLWQWLEEQGELILAGDFNLPRILPDGNSNPIYQKMSQKLCDNIPPETISTVDPFLHKANLADPGRLKLMVDYLWSTPKYKVGDVRVECGVSDHCAVVASIDIV